MAELGPTEQAPYPDWLEQGRLAAQAGSLDDYVGNDAARDEARTLVARIRRDGPFSSSSLPEPKAVLICGPTGVGKTHLARVIAASLGAGGAAVACFEINGSQLSAARIEELKAVLAHNDDRLVIVVDEVAPAVRPWPGFGERDDTLVALLGLLDGVRRYDQVTFILTTTRPPEVIDQAVMRPGRVDVTIELLPPGKHGREALVRLFVAELPLEPELSPVRVAEAIGPRATAAVIHGRLIDAMARAIADGRDRISPDDLEAALGRAGRVVSIEVNPDLRRRIAVHEAGHALVATLLGTPPAEVRIRVDGGHTSFDARLGDRTIDSDVRDAIAEAIAGIEAERLVLGEVGLGGERDIIAASRMARHRILSGLDGYVPAHPAAFDDRGVVEAAVVGSVERTIDEERRRAIGLLEANRAALHRLARRFEEEGALSGTELKGAIDEALGRHGDDEGRSEAA